MLTLNTSFIPKLSLYYKNLTAYCHLILIHREMLKPPPIYTIYNIGIKDIIGLIGHIKIND